jgi:hypothetical protein
MKSYLHGFAYFGKAGTAVECVLHDISDSGARIKFLAAPPIVDTIELHIPSKGRVHRARVPPPIFNRCDSALRSGTSGIGDSGIGAGGRELTCPLHQT